MDKNKLKVLRELPYTIHLCCGICKYGQFPQNNWGTCSKLTYEHEKHTNSVRQLSIFKYGTCSHWDGGKEFGEEVMPEAWREFVE